MPGVLSVELSDNSVPSHGNCYRSIFLWLSFKFCDQIYGVRGNINFCPPLKIAHQIRPLDGSRSLVSACNLGFSLYLVYARHLRKEGK